MIPYTYKMVDMDGVDLADFVGNTYSGLYSRILDSLDDRLIVILYNWRCADVRIPPAYVNITVFTNKVVINGLVEVNDDDTISIPNASEAPVILSLEVAENGVYTAPTGVDGYSPITVEVPPVPPVINSLSVTENGTYEPQTGVDGFAPVVVNVPPPPPVVNPLSVTQNGTYSAPSGVDGYNPVSVNVADTPALVTELNVNQNGRYEAPAGIDGYDPVIVNIPIIPVLVVPLSVTENGTYNVPSGTTGYGPVVVNVQAIQRPAVPSAYQEVEYLDFTPQIGITITVPTTGNFLYEAEFAPDTITPSSDMCALGWKTVSANNNKDFNLSVSTTGYFKSWLRAPGANYGFSFGEQLAATIGQKGNASVLLCNPREGMVVGRYTAYSSTGVNQQCLDGKLYFVRALNMNTGEYDVWLVPCYRKSDNQIGLYDVIRDIFFDTTYTTGSDYALVAGPDVN